jgi:hypothetical protein
MQRAIANAALSLALAASLAPAAALAAPAQPQQQNGVSYISGGVGQDEQNAMRALRSDYNLHRPRARPSSAASSSALGRRR